MPEKKRIAAISWNLKFIQNAGEDFIETPLLELEAVLAESGPRVPMLCILSTSSDPSLKIEQLARLKEKPVRLLSMGQGQEIHVRSRATSLLPKMTEFHRFFLQALRLLMECTNNGTWLLLQNVHLNVSFCSELHDILMEAEVGPSSLRCWCSRSLFSMGLCVSWAPWNRRCTTASGCGSPPRCTRAFP